MAHSGAVLPKSRDYATADIASTGGPGSLSTLIAPLYLRAAGCMVPKLGVPGRPAGGIDVLAQLPGYKFELSKNEILAYAWSGAGTHISLRMRASRLWMPSSSAIDREMVDKTFRVLAAASLLAKKIAVGLDLVGLDVRVASHGNFGRHFDEARDSAKLFCAAAEMGQIRAVAELTDGKQPYQPYLGRGEALLGLKLILQSASSQWLASHARVCQEMTEHVIDLIDENSGSLEQCSPEAAFLGNIEAQGSSTDAFYEIAGRIAKAPRRDLASDRAGYASIDVERLRSLFERINVPEGRISRFPDEFGVILRYVPAARLSRGDPIASLRVSESAWQCFG